MPLGADTNTHTYVDANKNDFKKPGIRGQRFCTPGLKTNFCSPAVLHVWSKAANLGELTAQNYDMHGLKL